MLRAAVLGLLLAVLLAGCTANGPASATLCSELPEDTTEYMGTVWAKVDATGNGRPQEGPPVERGIPFEIAVVIDDAPDMSVILEFGADLVVRDDAGKDLYRSHAAAEELRGSGDFVVRFDPAPCYLGASYDFDYGTHSVPLHIEVSTAAACSDRPTEDGNDWALLSVIDGELTETDWDLGPQPFAVHLSWYPVSQAPQDGEANLVVRVDGNVVDTVKGWPNDENDEDSFGLWFEQIPCIKGAEYFFEYPGHSLRWHPNLLE